MAPNTDKSDNPSNKPFKQRKPLSKCFFPFAQ